MIEIRWHARAGQGAKTASQIYATAELRAGRSVQAFPEYGPERRGAPLRAFTRVDERPIRRHDAIDHPDVVVVLEPSLVHEVDVAEGMQPHGVVLVSGDEPPACLDGHDVRCVPASGRLANLVMLGALSAVLREPPVELVADAAAEQLGSKVDAAEIRRAVGEGFKCLSS